jgi:hypothetical protein
MRAAKAGKPVRMGVALMAAAFSLFWGGAMGSTDSKTAFTYVVTETGQATSLDPLDADSTNNLPVARMLYFTPLEVSLEDRLESHVLSAFGFDEATSTISWRVRDGLTFSDGTPLTAEDVAFSVLRMAKARPSFPVIRDIRGVAEWAGRTDALRTMPDGMTLAKSEISIRLSRKVDHPLFRFALEIFSIVPKRCVDLDTGKLTCPEPPSSGFYVLKNRSADRWRFERREDSTVPDAVRRPKAIEFAYVSPRDMVAVAAKLDGRTVIAGHEGLLPPSEVRGLLAKHDSRALPASRFSVLQINAASAPFKDKLCRRVFADAFREAYETVAGDILPTEGSIFTKILPGYISLPELRQAFPVAPEDRSRCLAVLRATPPRWGHAKGRPMPPSYEQAMRAAFEALGLRTSEPREFSSGPELFEAFHDGEIQLMSIATGFWPLDPAGDLQMLFTPNLHRPLARVAADGKLQELIEKTQTGADSALKAKSFAEVNRHLFDDAQFNPYNHFRRFYLGKDNPTLRRLPSSITAPAPWQVFPQN